MLRVYVAWRRRLAMLRKTLAAFVAACITAAACLASASQASAQGGDYIQTQQFRGSAETHYSTETACWGSQSDANYQSIKFGERLGDINPDHWISRHVKNAEARQKRRLPVQRQRQPGHEVQRGHSLQQIHLPDHHHRRFLRQIARRGPITRASPAPYRQPVYPDACGRALRTGRTLWHGRHRLRKFSGAFVPPRHGGRMWSTSSRPPAPQRWQR